MSIKFRPYDAILDDYKTYHKNKVNQIIHRIAVPLIFLSAFGLIKHVPVPSLFDFIPHFNFAALAGFIFLVYYTNYGSRTFLIMTAFYSLIAFIITAIELFIPEHALLIHTIIMISAGGLQLLGHVVEGRRPAFFDDMRTIPLGMILVYFPHAPQKAPHKE